MTLNSVREYVAAIRDRYQKANKKEKGLILDEFVKVTSYHRKAATRLLGKPSKPVGKQQGRQPEYQTVLTPLKIIWEASDQLCSKRLKPFLPESIRVFKRSGEMRRKLLFKHPLCCQCGQWQNLMSTSLEEVSGDGRQAIH